MNLIRSLPGVIKASPVESVVVAALTLTLGYFALPLNVDATTNLEVENKAVALEVAAMQNETLDYGVLPESELRGPSYTITVPATAYTSRPEETDDTPFITASGTHVRFGVIATNFLPIGTRVKIPDMYGDQIFVVEDRMNKRYNKRVDIWMEDLTDARQFGVRNVTLEVYSNK